MASAGVTLAAVVFFPYLLRLAAFHFAQRARWAAAIRLRAAADITLGFMPSVRARPTFPLDSPRPASALRAESNCSNFLRACSLSFFNCRTALARFIMIPPRAGIVAARLEPRDSRTPFLVPAADLSKTLSGGIP
jgi:hypothetical protein